MYMYWILYLYFLYQVLRGLGSGELFVAVPTEPNYPTTIVISIMLLYLVLMPQNKT